MTWILLLAPLTFDRGAPPLRSPDSPQGPAMPPSLAAPPALESLVALRTARRAARPGQSAGAAPALGRTATELVRGTDLPAAQHAVLRAGVGPGRPPDVRRRPLAVGGRRQFRRWRRRLFRGGLGSRARDQLDGLRRVSQVLLFRRARDVPARRRWMPEPAPAHPDRGSGRDRRDDDDTGNPCALHPNPPRVPDARSSHPCNEGIHRYSGSK